MSTPGKSWQCLIAPGAAVALRFWWAVTVLFPFSSKQRLGASRAGELCVSSSPQWCLRVWSRVKEQRLLIFHLFEVVLQFRHLGKTLPRFEKQVMWLEGLVGMNSTINFGTEPVESISRNLVCFTIQTKKKPSRISTRTPRTSRCEVHLVAVFETFLRKP